MIRACANTQHNAANLYVMYSVEKGPAIEASTVNLGSTSASEVMEPHLVWIVGYDKVSAACEKAGMIRASKS